jgi:hypothetical protein
LSQLNSVCACEIVKRKKRKKTETKEIKEVRWEGIKKSE